MTTGALFLELHKLQQHIDEVKALFRARTDSTAYDLQQRSCIRKKRYANPEGAGRGASKARANGSTDELRVYACAFCGGYHLTKVSLEELVGVSR